MKTYRRRVVVTGMGALCGAGASVDAIIDRALAGRSAMRPISRFDARRHATRIAAEIPEPLMPGRDPCLEWGKRAAKAAVAAAGPGAFRCPDRAGVYVGTALGRVHVRELASSQAPGASLLGMAPEIGPWIATTIGGVARSLTMTSAFAASADAIGLALWEIGTGAIDVALAGGIEAPITPLVLAGFAAMGALSADNGCPERSIRPFDKDRNGCGLGEGAAFLVLEERQRALARGATIFAEIAGYGSSADALHITQLPETGEGLVRAMSDALEDAGVGPDEIGYINAHGTGTAMNDRVETRAIHEVFGSHAARLGVSSTKPVTGHLLGAAGAMEAVITIGAMRSGLMPPTANWSSRDHECDLDYVPDGPRKGNLRVAMSNSMGFGGHNAALVFRAHEG